MSWRALALSARQLAKIEKHCAAVEAKFDRNKLASAFEFWHKKMSIGEFLDRDRRPINQTAIINDVLVNKEPDLLLIDIKEMETRMENFTELGFLNPLDRLFVFREAPGAWFLQDWTEFAKKFNFIQFRILQWILKNEKDKWPEPHPLIKNCRVMEKPYEHIKTRYYIAKTAGIPISKLNGRGGDKLHFEKCLKVLLATDTEYFLDTVLPGVKQEEYDYLEKMMKEDEAPEDKVMKEYADLFHDLTEDFEKDEYFAELEKVSHLKIKA